MKKVLRSKTTGRFLKAPGRWTNDLASARPITDRDEAAKIRDTLSLRDVELYFASVSDKAPSRWDFTLSLD